MGIAEYERLLSRLGDALDGPEAREQRRKRSAAIASCEERLIQQQADLVHAATRLRLPAPRMDTAMPDDGSEPVDVDDEIRRADLSSAAAASALSKAEARARRPALMPDSRPKVRNAVVYALAAAAGILPQGIALANQGMPDATATVFVLIPLLAFLGDLIAVGPASAAHIRPPRDRRRPPLRRDARTGAIICAVIGVAAGLAWLSVL